MKTIEYHQFGEQLFVEKLANGLTVYLQPKRGFHKTIATLGVNYGSVDSQFNLAGKLISQPAGIAHFLEHKMFDKKDYDVFELFNQTGASANAYTSFTNTNYLFSTAGNLKKNLMILLDFVQIPYFTEEKVTREKGIIDQEINMYRNDAGNRIYFQTVADLYPNSPLALDIAGSVDSVSQITLADVQTAYQTFYRPENMALFITGNLDPIETLDWIKENQKQKPAASPIDVTRHVPIPAAAREAIHQHSMQITRPKVAVGIRGDDVVPTGRAGVKYEMAISMMLDLFFSETAATYDDLYQDGVIDDSFSWEFENERAFHFALLSADSDNPDEFITKIHQVIDQIPEKLPKLTATFELQKRELYGNYIEMMDSQEAISGQFNGFLGEPVTIYDEVDILNRLSLEDVLRITETFLKSSTIQSEIIRAKA